MPRAGVSAQATKLPESQVPQQNLVVESEEDVEDEEVEYEEVEEEVEEEEEIEEEVEEEDGDGEETAVVNAVDANAITAHDEDMKDDEENEHKKHDELLALPQHGSEVYVGGIPHGVSTEDLKSFCETAGEVLDVRMISGKDKVYAFVTYRMKEMAKNAIETLKNKDLKGKKVKLSTSQAKNRLFIGNVPRHWVEDDLKSVVSKLGPGVTGVQLIKDPQTPSRNRGFAFIEYHNHECADYSRKKMSNPGFKLDSNAVTVNWADPKSGDSGLSAQIKAIYVKNLPKNVTEGQLKKLFERHGEITKVALPHVKSGVKNRIGFVHFAERSYAMKALQNSEIYELDGHVLECSIAKPPADKNMATVTDVRKGSLLPNYQLQPGLLGGGYGALPAGFAQPMAYGGGTPGVAMVPMVLPDGRIGYVVQQPGVPVASLQSSIGRDGKHGNNAGRGGLRYHPY